MALVSKKEIEKFGTYVANLACIATVTTGAVYGYGQGWLQSGDTFANRVHIEVALADSACVKKTVTVLAQHRIGLQISDLRDIRKECNKEQAIANQYNQTFSRSK